MYQISIRRKTGVNLSCNSVLPIRIAIYFFRISITKIDSIINVEVVSWVMGIAQSLIQDIHSRQDSFPSDSCSRYRKL